MPNPMAKNFYELKILVLFSLFNLSLFCYVKDVWLFQKDLWWKKMKTQGLDRMVLYPPVTVKQKADLFFKNKGLSIKL